MTSVTQFAQHLMRLDPHRSPARQCLFNYLKHIIDPIEPFTPQVIEDFYNRALHLDFWRQNHKELGQSVKKDLASYFNQEPESKDLDWDHIRHADEIQVLNIHNEKDFLKILAEDENSKLQSGDRLKLIPTGSHQILSMILSEVGTLEVKLYPLIASISGARLKPLGPISHLYYNSKMELMPHVRQTLEGSLLTVISFSLEEDGLHGVVSRGHGFQKFETFIKSKPSDHYDLFNQLKKLERFYINPQSDPYYREIVSALEQSSLRLKTPSPMILQMAEKNLLKGQSALKNAFPGDRLLKLLVTHLDLGLQQAKYGKAKSHSTEQVSG